MERIIQGAADQRQMLGKQIIDGLQHNGVQEDQSSWFFTNLNTGRVQCCALGFAVVGKTGGVEQARAALYNTQDYQNDFLHGLCALLEIPFKLGVAVSHLHQHGDVPAIEIAAMLGYKEKQTEEPFEAWADHGADRILVGTSSY